MAQRVRNSFMMLWGLNVWFHALALTTTKKPANLPSVILTTESIDINNGAVRSEATISDESTSLIGDGCDSPILETEAEKDAPVENDTESNTQPPSVYTSCHEDDVTVSKESQPAQIVANNAYKSPSAIGCCALDEQVIGADAAAPQSKAVFTLP